LPPSIGIQGPLLLPRELTVPQKVVMRGKRARKSLFLVSYPEFNRDALDIAARCSRFFPGKKNDTLVKTAIRGAREIRAVTRRETFKAFGFYDEIMTYKEATEIFAFIK